MSEIVKKKVPAAAGKNIKKTDGGNIDDALGLNDVRAETADAGMKASPENLLVMEEIIDLLSSEDIVNAVKKFKADTGEKEIAVEFANSHTQFLKQIVESDYKKGIVRTDVEVRDVISHANTMLKKKDESLFMTIIMHCPLHYRNIQKKYYAKIKKQEEDKSKTN